MSKRYIVSINQQEYEVLLLADNRVVVNGEELPYHVASRTHGELSLLLDGLSYEVHAADTSLDSQTNDVTFLLNGMEIRATVDDPSSLLLKTLLRTQHRSSGTRQLRAPMPGLVTKIEVQKGEVVQAGQGLIILEAMKMENEIRSPEAATIEEIHVNSGTAVEKGSLLITIRY